MKPTREEVLRLMRQASGGILTQVAEDPRCGYEIKVEELQTFAALLQTQASNECGSVPDGFTLIGELVEIDDGVGTKIFECNEERYWLPAGTKIYAASPSGMQPPHNQPNSDHVAVQLAEPESRLRGSHIKGTLAHDAGAYACCSYCGRYSDNPCALSLRSFKCDCGKDTGWSGSFKPPTAQSTWGGPESGISSPSHRPNEQKSYVGNFGDTGEAQLRRELANVPLPNYMEGK